MIGTIKIVLFSITIILLNSICALAGSLPDTGQPRDYTEFYDAANTAREKTLESDTGWMPTVRAGHGAASSAEIKVTADEDLPDLVVLNYLAKSWEIQVGEQFWIRAEVSNAGAGPAGPSHVKLYLSTDNDWDVSDDYYVGEKSVGALAPGENERPQWDFTMPDIGSGTYSFWVVFVVDCYNAVTESEEKNTFLGNNNINAISPCSYNISPTSGTLDPSGGSGSINVTDGGGCGWEAKSDSSWVTITSNDCGSGDGKVDYSVSSNSSGETRSGAVTISGEAFTVSQAGGSNCSYSISPKSNTYPASGGSGSVNVTGQNECYWDATADSSWITITSDSWGHGEGCVNYSVFANYTESSRSGTLTIGGKAFTVTQNPGPAEPERYVFERLWPVLEQPWYFILPKDIVVNGKGNVYVMDHYNNRIQKFSSSGAFITKWGSEGDGDGEFDNPQSIAIDGQGNVYVADANNNRIQKFTSSGAFITKWGSEGSGDGELMGPF